MSTIEHNKTTYPLAMDQAFAELLQRVFGDLLVVGFVNGRAALYFKRSGMDVDVFTVLKDEIVDNQEKFKTMWQQFVIGYRDIHLHYGFKPDNAFPGDFATVSQLEEMAQGRGFVSNHGKVWMPPMTDIACENDENDYRIFRSMVIIGRAIIGDAAYLDTIRLSALKTVLRYIYLQRGPLSIEQIIAEITSGPEKQGYGFDERYQPALTEFLTPWLEQAVAQLRHEGIAPEQLHQWEQHVLAKQWQAFHLMPFQDPWYVAERERLFAGVVAGSHYDKLTTTS
ncbi:MAG: hypothetical protein HYV33_05650 [Candidatus Kerfeldbacteria bacterium]|nr:hypothetical protein [Candidatus Kerfeldbacteria bacterium]